MSQSGEKTEKASPKKRRDAREKGQVLKSTEVNTAISLLAMFGMIKLLSSFIGQQALRLMRSFLSPAYAGTVTVMHMNNLYPAIVDVLIAIALILGPLLMCAMIVGVCINLMQVGFLFTTKTLTPKFSRINPMQGFKRIFSTRSLVEMGKSIAKVAIIGWIVYDEYMKSFAALPSMMDMHISAAMEVIVETILNIGFKAGLALMIIAVLDYAYQWWSYEKELKMSKQEVKDEYKQMEGDPQVKNRIRQKQREMGMMRMMQSVPDADVVITNPTHYAVALVYKDEEMSAPVVIAKGKDLIAKRIREIAKENNIEVVENKPVAQALFAHCEVGDPIPDMMYQAVAEILALVYKARNAAAGGTVR